MTKNRKKERKKKKKEIQIFLCKILFLSQFFFLSNLFFFLKILKELEKRNSNLLKKNFHFLFQLNSFPSFPIWKGMNNCFTKSSKVSLFQPFKHHSFHIVPGTSFLSWIFLLFFLVNSVHLRELFSQNFYYSSRRPHPSPQSPLPPKANHYYHCVDFVFFTITFHPLEHGFFWHFRIDILVFWHNLVLKK